MSRRGRPPRYPLIVEDIKKRIEKGEIRGKFPTYRETVAYYKASSRTIDQVWEALKAEEIIECVPGQVTKLKKEA